MKDLTLSVVGVLVLALSMGLAFHWFYPRVNLTSELAGLFVFVAVVLKLGLSRLWSLRRRSRRPADTEANK